MPHTYVPSFRKTDASPRVLNESQETLYPCMKLCTCSLLLFVQSWRATQIRAKTEEHVMKDLTMWGSPVRVRMDLVVTRATQVGIHRKDTFIGAYHFYCCFDHSDY